MVKTYPGKKIHSFPKFHDDEKGVVIHEEQADKHINIRFYKYI